MTLRLFDTATRDVRDFVPQTPGEVGIYLCGATVQAAPHIGHMRSAVAFDLLVRWLRRAGSRVTLIRNVTDIDDKILAKSAAAGEPWWAWAATYERAFTAAYDALGVLPPTYEPRATGHVPDMVELMERLVGRGHAYTTGPGDVWFDVRSWREYGSLTNQRLEDLNPVPDDVPADAHEAAAKHDPRDFALWKAPKDDEPATASWETPFGRGRPGWHLECSAMARRYLGDTFDIHGGGLDLRFPHHENEQAQSHAAGYGFARHWLHSAWVTQGGTKMSKSLGNGLLVREVLETTSPAVLRYALASVQYRSMLEWTPATVTEAQTTWERLAGFVERATERVGDVGDVRDAELPTAFTTAMDDDLNVPAALAVVHEHLRAGNSALADRSSAADAVARHHLVALRAMLEVLGLDPGDPQWADAGDSRYAAALDAVVGAEISARAEARAARDFATADAIRDRLAAAGIVVEDSADGARWSLG
ncbi:cysteine--tRNA ligase [Cellulosimicrobium sp. Marseille-Q4280]|uniref:cysteine--tRNA ligase n=1 Tax=Cellulosimicrobium sp. Marseille-Q4280 TaxID=2937992 RepID=UPI00203D2AA2|nr:cysteine--tRNA ligase [Cellulosimicrobium sp. Marseille-Q4280]